MEEAVLILEETEKDGDGYPVTKEKRIEIGVLREKSATRSERYAAMNAGIEVKFILEIRPEDFELSRHRDAQGKRAYARKIEYDGAVYDIARHYQNDKSLVELSLS